MPDLNIPIPLSQIPENNNPGDNDVLLSGSEAGIFQKTKMEFFNAKLNTGINGVATQSNAPTPWVSGDPDLFERYLVHEPITSPNSWSNIVVSAGDLDIVSGVANNRVILEVNNGVATKRIERVKGGPGADSNLATVENTDGSFGIMDNMGKVAFLITPEGLVDFTMSDELKLKIKNLSGLIENDEGSFGLLDDEGFISFLVSDDGTVSFAKLSTETISYLQAVINGTSDKINGKKIGVLGDSISLPDGAAGLLPAETYYGRLIAQNNCTVITNAVGGSCITSGGAVQIDMTDDARWGTFTGQNCGVILIFGGINDFLQDIPLGVFGDTSKTASFYGALDYLYRNLMNANPNTRIFHMTPMHMRHTQAGGLNPEFNGQNYLTDYIDAIEKVAKRYGVGVINTFQDSGITWYSIPTYATDNIHVNKYGHELIYKTVINETNKKL